MRPAVSTTGSAAAAGAAAWQQRRDRECDRGRQPRELGGGVAGSSGNSPPGSRRTAPPRSPRPRRSPSASAPERRTRPESPQPPPSGGPSGETGRRQMMNVAAGVDARERRPADAEGLDLGRRRRLAVERELGHDPADQRRELVPVRRARARPARRDDRAGRRGRSRGRGSACTGRSWSGTARPPCPAGGPRGRRSPARGRPRRDRTCGSPWSPAVRPRPVRSWVPGARGSGSRRTTARPSRSRPGTGPGRSGDGVPARREPADLLLGHRQRQAGAERLEQVVRPRVGGDDHPAGRQPLAVLEDHDASPRSPSSIRATGACSRSTAPCSVARRRWATLPRDGSASPPSAWNRPTCPSSSRQAGQRRTISATVELLERHALGGHRPGVLADVDGDARRPSRAAPRRGRRCGTRPACRSRARPRPTPRRPGRSAARSRGGGRSGG